MSVSLYDGDCIKIMKDIKEKSIDMILCDLPYGVTQCEWDVKLPFEPLWKQYKRIIKDNGAIVLFSQQPFTAELIMSNKSMFRYEWIYEKTNCTGFLNANRMPLKKHENICVFYKRLPKYNPQFTTGKPYYRSEHSISSVYRDYKMRATLNSGSRYPTDVIKFNNANGLNKKFHQTEKPIDLLEYLIQTYTDKGETVLDNCMGAGSCGIACVHTNRNFIGIELDNDFFDIAKHRIEKAKTLQ